MRLNPGMKNKPIGLHWGWRLIFPNYLLPQNDYILSLKSFQRQDKNVSKKWVKEKTRNDIQSISILWVKC